MEDSENDFPMLRNVDIPVLIKTRREVMRNSRRGGLIISKLTEPAGRNEVVLNLIG